MTLLSKVTCIASQDILLYITTREYGDSGQISTWKFQHFSILNFKTKISHYLIYSYSYCLTTTVSLFLCGILGETLILKHIYALCILQFYHCLQSLHFINASCSQNSTVLTTGMHTFQTNYILKWNIIKSSFKLLINETFTHIQITHTQSWKCTPHFFHYCMYNNPSVRESEWSQLLILLRTESKGSHPSFWLASNEPSRHSTP